MDTDPYSADRRCGGNRAADTPLTKFAKEDQSRIFEIGRRMIHGDYISRIKAEGELLREVSALVVTIEKRSQHPKGCL